MFRILLLCLGLFSAAVFAAEPVSPEQRKLAEDYFRISGLQDSYSNRDRLQAMLQAEMQAMEVAYAEKMTPQQAYDFHRFMVGFSPVLNYITSNYMEKIQPELVDAVARTYSAEELVAMNEFYSSGIGKGIVAKNPAFTNSIMAIVASYTGEMSQQVRQSLAEHLQAWSQNSRTRPPTGK